MSLNIQQMTAVEAVAAWDRGDIISTISMGGIGPGYEQAIQTLVIEMLRDALAEEAATNEHASAERFKDIADAAVKKHNATLGGVTGAMFGAAINLAYRAYNDGWSGMLEKAKDDGVADDRFIMASKAWPHAKETP